MHSKKHRKIKKIFNSILIFTTVFCWQFSGWPKISETLVFPPDVEIAQAAVPSGVIIAWSGTAASIPSGWSRVTALDTYYLEGTTANPSATPGGSSTHGHASPAHAHTAGHTHTGTTGVGS